MKPFQQRFEDAIVLLEDNQPVDALAIASELIEEEPDNPDPAILIAMALYKAKRQGAAMLVYEAAIKRAPNRASLYSNMACCLIEQSPEKALEYLEAAEKIQPMVVNTLANLCSVHCSLGNYDTSLEYADRCLSIDPNNSDAIYNSSLVLLGQGNWAEGWPRWDVSLGNKFRKEREYNPEEYRWEPGMKKGETVVIYGEQGLGDEVMFASMLPRVKDTGAKEIIVQCDKRLEGLFRRSFPQFTIEGSRGSEWRDWYERVDAKLEMGGLGKYFATEPFSGTAYLTADPLRRKQWRVLLDSLGDKPKIGIAWNGGSPNTGEKKRSIPLEKWRTVFAGIDAEFVSLEYREGEAFPFIHEFPWGTRTQDYDDTAALVSELDLVIAVTTTVVDLCGALGKECWALVPEVPPWRYAHDGDGMFFYDSVRVFRSKGDWAPVMQEVVDAWNKRGIRETEQRVA